MAEQVELATDKGAGVINRAEWLAMKGPLDKRVEATRAAVAAVQGARSLARWMSEGEESMRVQWPDLSFDVQCARLRDVIDFVTILPATRGNRFDPDRLVPTYRG